jgi:hypothetical protein
MPTQKTIPEILNIAKVSQYLAFNDVENNVFLRGGALDRRLPLMITCERLFIQWKYEVDPADSSLRGCANYLYDLLGKYALQAENIIGDVSLAKPIVSGPADQTLNGSGTASFTVSVVSPLTYVISWYKNGVLVPGETGLTYTYAATLADDGDEVNAVATSAAGSTSSRVATLTVNTALIGYVYYGPIDHFDDINSGVDNVTYSFTFPITDGQPFQITMPAGAANNQYELFKVPASQSIKAVWFNTVLNNGTIPDFVMRQYINIGGSGGWNYYLSRNAMSIDVSSSPNMTLS